ncbi:hypothetical protein DOTSEDRAFT_68974 [Dothistroma septosporum NZE10]|uniref:CCHC-type domain-containing protein n=1 Tax=Dothistroma septosporum (strain NZE10 / CBS 128990) TaxID=675120 RepID=N1Q3L9_DOTSN|nr:hypothetical protein DOTSEDRAFT_68974 [Dothistroma septosporum NZE10]
MDAGSVFEPGEAGDALTSNVTTDSARITNLEQRVSALELRDSTVEKDAPDSLIQHLESLGTSILDLGLSHPSYQKMATSFLAIVNEYGKSDDADPWSALGVIKFKLEEQQKRPEFNHSKHESESFDGWAATPAPTSSRGWEGSPLQTARAADSFVFSDFSDKNGQAYGGRGGPTTKRQTNGWGASPSPTLPASAKQHKSDLPRDYCFDVRDFNVKSEYGPDLCRPRQTRRRTYCFLCGFSGHNEKDCHLEASKRTPSN